MGRAFHRNVTTWSRGDYPNADNADDELALIAAKGVASAPLSAGATADAAPELNATAGVARGVARASVQGTLTPAARALYYALPPLPVAGWVEVNATPPAPWVDAFGTWGVANAKLKLELWRGVDLLAASDAAGAPPPPDALGLGAALKVRLNATAAGANGSAPPYVIAISGVDWAEAGFTAYGSLGSYALNASWPVATQPPPPPPPRRPRSPPPPPPLPRLAPQAGALSTLQPRVVVIQGVTLCTGAKAGDENNWGWYGWLKRRLHRRPPAFLEVISK